MGRGRLVAGVVASVLILSTPAVRLAVVTATALSAAGCQKEDQCTIEITTPDPLPEGRVGSAYFFQFDASGGCATRVWSPSDALLPPGMKFSKDGALDGVPTKDGSYTFFVAVNGIDTSASLASHVSSRRYTLVIHPA